VSLFFDRGKVHHTIKIAKANAIPASNKIQTMMFARRDENRILIQTL
jgi:hypothetical protein